MKTRRSETSHHNDILMAQREVGRAEQWEQKGRMGPTETLLMDPFRQGTWAVDRTQSNC